MSITDLQDIFELFAKGVGVGVVLSTFPYILGLGISTLFKIAKS